MPKLVTPLMDTQVKNAKPKDKPYKLVDGGGMYLEVMPTGGKPWRMKYWQVNGQDNRLAFGSYPETTMLKYPKGRLLCGRRMSRFSSKLITEAKRANHKLQITGITPNDSAFNVD